MNSAPTYAPIDAPTAYRLLAEVVAETGEDFTYSMPAYAGKCVYVWSGEPHCLIGKSLAKHGVTVGDLETYDALDTSHIWAIEDATPFIDTKAREVFKVAQRCQDDGMTYGYALGSARDTLGQYGYKATA